MGPDQVRSVEEGFALDFGEVREGRMEMRQHWSRDPKSPSRQTPWGTRGSESSHCKGPEVGPGGRQRG